MPAVVGGAEGAGEDGEEAEEEEIREPTSGEKRISATDFFHPI
jgi:hypothetical protein